MKNAGVVCPRCNAWVPNPDGEPYPLAKHACENTIPDAIVIHQRDPMCRTWARLLPSGDLQLYEEWRRDENAEWGVGTDYFDHEAISLQPEAIENLMKFLKANGR